MKQFLLAYLVTAVAFLGLDSIWLTVTASRLYKPMIGWMLADGFRLVPAMLFYLLYVAGIVAFAVLPALRSGRWTTAALYAGFLGLVAYGTYDLTNQATVRDWPWLLTLADMTWGMVLSATAASIAFSVVR